MDSPPYVAHLRSELDTFEACLGGDLSVPIEHCGDWTLHDLADHLDRGNLWAAVAITENRGDYQAAEAPRNQADLVSWFHAASAVLLDALDPDPATPAWTIFPPRTVGFWQRRRCLEALVHRWDAEQALGVRTTLDSVLAGDGVAEVIDTIAPRQIELGRASAPDHAVRFAATDADSSWVWGPGDPVATVSATTAELLLMLWGRISSGDQAITWQGDRAAAHVIRLAGAVDPDEIPPSNVQYRSQAPSFTHEPGRMQRLVPV